MWSMASNPLPDLLKLSAADRAQLAIALWDSLTDAERDAQMLLSDEDRAELDRRWAEHLENPDSGVPWAEVRTKLLG